jgi:uncharacterized BrkB/YihY/UPF0761 family membrane protein
MSFLRDPKRLIATLIAGVAGLIVLIDATARTLLGWGALVAAVALLVGVLHVLSNHITRVRERRNDWRYSAVLMITMLVVIVLGILIGPTYDPGSGAVGFVVLPGLIEQPFRGFFTSVYQPLASSFLALLAFFSLSAALRGVRRRSPEAIVIVLVALTVLLLTALPQTDTVPLIGETLRWMTNYPVLAAARGLLLGAAIGALVAGVRVLLGLDQPFLDR